MNDEQQTYDNLLARLQAMSELQAQQDICLYPIPISAEERRAILSGKSKHDQRWHGVAYEDRPILAFDADFGTVLVEPR